jgi:aminodeoxyfutalosine deaminase
MFDTDLDREYEAAAALGVGARATYEADLAGAVCDEATRARLSALGRSAEWSA